MQKKEEHANFSQFNHHPFGWSLVMVKIRSNGQIRPDIRLPSFYSVCEKLLCGPQLGCCCWFCSPLLLKAVTQFPPSPLLLNIWSGPSLESVFPITSREIIGLAAKVAPRWILMSSRTWTFGLANIPSRNSRAAALAGFQSRNEA